ncbi:peptide chain release factor N(5)-glutamine methyltransferase [Roseibium denhamense]|nr:peptide chain release factor N(5)-glutamine methyltransferase [Roseibium denhamense]
MLIGQLRRLVRDRLREEGLPTPDLDARLLVAHALGMSVSELLLHEDDDVAPEKEAHVHAVCALRLKGMPVGRIAGEREFYGRRFFLNAATLEPRPDTEVLIDAVLARASADHPLTIADIGTGSGAIAVTLLAELPQSCAVAVDVAEDALVAARNNASLHSVLDRLLLVRADYASALGNGYDWLVSNPPYIRQSVLATLSKDVLDHDPILALDGGKDGLSAYRSICTGAARLLKRGGRIALEIGFDQADDVKKTLRHHDFGAIEIIRDLSGNDRVVVGRLE